MSKNFKINFFTSSEFYIFNVDIYFPYILCVSADQTSIQHEESYRKISYLFSEYQQALEPQIHSLFSKCQQALKPNFAKQFVIVL